MARVPIEIREPTTEHREVPLGKIGELTVGFAKLRSSKDVSAQISGLEEMTERVRKLTLEDLAADPVGAQVLMVMGEKQPATMTDERAIAAFADFARVIQENLGELLAQRELETAEEARRTGTHRVQVQILGETFEMSMTGAARDYLSKAVQEMFAPSDSGHPTIGRPKKD